MGVALHIIGVEADRAHKLRNPILHLAALGDAVDDKGLTDDVLDGQPRVERAKGVLEDHAHLAAQRLHLLLV